MSEKAETVTTRVGMASPPPGPAARQAPRHRRPTGAPPPLPHPVSVTTRAWLILAVVVLAGVTLISVRAPSLRLDNQVNSAVLRLFARARTPWLTDVANGISAAGSGWGATVAGLSTVVLTIVFRRWRHLLVFLCSLFLLQVAITLITSGTTRPRPYGVLIIGNWTGYSTQAVTVAVPTFLLISIAYCLVVPGRPRTYAKAATAVIVTMSCLARLYLAVDHLDDLLLGAALAVAIPVSAFRFFTPNEVFPVAYRRGNTAHVDVTGRRGDAIRQGTRVRFVLGQSGQPQTVTITLTATCDIAGARQIPFSQPGMRRFERPPSLVPGYSDVRYDIFPGGCVTYRFVLAPGASTVLATTVGSAVAFVPRSELVGYVRRTEGLALCGRGAACPG